MFGVLFVLVVLLLCRKNHERVILFVGRHVGCVVMEQTSTQISKVHKLGLIWVAIKQDKCDSEASCISHAIKKMLFFSTECIDMRLHEVHTLTESVRRESPRT